MRRKLHGYTSYGDKSEYLPILTNIFGYWNGMNMLLSDYVEQYIQIRAVRFIIQAKQIDSALT
jgi:hypothetical protein